MQEFKIDTLSEEKSPLLKACQKHILDLFNKHQDARLVFHNYTFTQELVSWAGTVAEAENLSPEKRELVLLAAWFLNAGRLFQYEHFEAKSCKLAESFLKDQKCEPDYINQVINCIKALFNKKLEDQKEFMILSDAQNLAILSDEFSDRSILLRLEEELILDRKTGKAAWASLQLRALMHIKLFTHFARTHFEPSLSQLINGQRKIVGKGGGNLGLEAELLDPKDRKFHDIERNVPDRAIQTFFRANYRNHINLSAIADNKANIMISVNYILISVLITALSYRNIAETNPVVLLPVVIFLVTGLTSLIFAVLSARPKVTSLNKNQDKALEIQKNIVFFGNFVSLRLDQYEEAMDAMFHDSSLIYGNMTRDLYHLGKVLDKKYRYLTVSYNIFMLGFIATVSTFIFALFS